MRAPENEPAAFAYQVVTTPVEQRRADVYVVHTENVNVEVARVVDVQGFAPLNASLTYTSPARNGGYKCRVKGPSSPRRVSGFESSRNPRFIVRYGRGRWELLLVEALYWVPSGYRAALRFGTIYVRGGYGTRFLGFSGK